MNIYVKKSMTAKWGEYLNRKKYFRLFLPSDEGTIRKSGLLLLTKGNPPRQSFSGYEIVSVDVFKVSNTMAEAYVRHEDGTGEPIRFKIASEKLLIIK